MSRKIFNPYTLIGAYDIYMGLYVMSLSRGLFWLAGLAGVAVGIICLWVGLEK